MHLYTYFPTLISNPVRLAAFRLIEAGLEQNPGIESMLLISIPTPNVNHARLVRFSIATRIAAGQQDRVRPLR